MDNFNSQDNNGGYQPTYTYTPQYQPEQKNPFALAAMILGLCSFMFLCTIFLPLPLGALSILFVILSRRHGKRLQSPAVTGLVTSIASMALSLVVIIMAIVSGFTMLKPENRDKLNEQYQQMYGVDFDEYMEDYMKEFYGETR